MKLDIFLYFDPVAIVINKIDLTAEVEAQLMQEEAYWEELPNYEYIQFPEELGEKDSLEFEKNWKKFLEIIENWSVSQLMKYIKVDTDSLDYRYEEDGCLVYDIGFEFDIMSILEKYT